MPTDSIYFGDWDAVDQFIERRDDIENRSQALREIVTLAEREGVLE